jgi:hypothetical protein
LPLSVPLPPLAPIVPITPPPPDRPAPNFLPENPRAPQVFGGLRQALSEYDRRLGLGSGGALISELDSRLAAGYVSGAALLEVRVDRQRRVRDVRVMDSSGGADAWNEFAANLVGTPLPTLRLPEPANGAWMQVRVEARPRMPSGRTPGRPAWLPGTLIAFDLSDLGAVEQRVGHARVVSEVWY